MELLGVWQSRYLHLNRSPCVQAGQAVGRGDMIGRVGDSGISVLGIDLSPMIRNPGFEGAWTDEALRGFSLCGDVETSFGFPSSRAHGQELHGIMQSNATRFPSPGILGCVAMWSAAQL